MIRLNDLPRPPELPAKGEGLTRLEGPEGAARLYTLASTEESGEGLYLRGVDLTGEELDGLTLARCILEDCRLTSAGLRKASFTDCLALSTCSISRRVRSR